MYPFTEIVIEGNTYKMCFSFAALAMAEISLRNQGYDVNLLQGLIVRTFATLRVLFAASLHVYHPELLFEATMDWLTPYNAHEVLLAVNKAWALSHDDGSKEEKNPPEPGE
jgi:hypothetical protein